MLDAVGVAVVAAFLSFMLSLLLYAAAVICCCCCCCGCCCCCCCCCCCFLFATVAAAVDTAIVAVVNVVVAVLARVPVLTRFLPLVLFRLRTFINMSCRHHHRHCCGRCFCHYHCEVMIAAVFAATVLLLLFLQR